MGRDSLSSKVKRAAHRVGEVQHDDAAAVGASIQESPYYRWFVTAGLLAYGLVHLVIALLAAGLAWDMVPSSAEASETGALTAVASQPFGWLVIAFSGVGLASLVGWQVIEAAVGHTHLTGAKRLRKRLSSVAKAVLYGALSWSAFEVLGGVKSDGEEQQESLTAEVLSFPGGAVLVGLAALVIMGVGVYHVAKGIRASFDVDLTKAVPHWAMILGRVGYGAKGVAITVVGLLFGWAAITHDPESAGNTGSALRAILEQPFGPYLLTVVAAGLAAFGLYCGVWAFNARHEAEDSRD